MPLVLRFMQLAYKNFVKTERVRPCPELKSFLDATSRMVRNAQRFINYCNSVESFANISVIDEFMYVSDIDADTSEE